MRPKKIAIYSGEIPSTTFIERLIEGLAKDGFEIYLFGHQTRKVFYSKNIFVYSYSNRFNKFFTLIKYSFLLWIFKTSDKIKLDNFIQSQNGNTTLMKIKYYPVLYHKPDILHLQWAKGIKNWMWVQDFGIKLILSLRGTHLTISPITNITLANEFKNFFPKIEGFHAVSNTIYKEAIKHGANPSICEVIFSGLEIEKFPFQSHKLQNKKIKILSIGRSHWVKGYNYALDAFSLLKKDNFDFNFTIIGIEIDEELIFQSSQLGLENEVVFEKSLPFQDIVATIQQSDVLLLPSVEEGIANVVLEAMALGTIVLSTNCGGMDEVIINGKNGFLVPIRNPEAIAQKIKLISALPEDEKQVIRENARATIAKQHSSDTMIVKMKNLYSKVLNTAN